MVLPSAGLLSGCPPLLASDGSLPGKAASGRGEDPREAVPAQLHDQTQRPSLHVGRQRFYQTSPSTWYSSYSMGRDSRVSPLILTIDLYANFLAFSFTNEKTESKKNLPKVTLGVNIQAEI